MLRFLTQPLNWKQTRVKRKSEQKKLDHKNKIEKEKVFDEYIFPGILRSLNAKGDLFYLCNIAKSYDEIKIEKLHFIR